MYQFSSKLHLLFNMVSEISVNLSERGKKSKLQVNQRHIVSDTSKGQLTEGYVYTNPPAPLPKKPQTKNTTIRSQNQSTKQKESKKIKMTYNLNRNLLC